MICTDLMAYFRRMQCSPNSGFAPSSRDTAVSQRLLRGSAFFPPPPLPGCPDASNTDFNVTVYNTSLVFYSCTKDFLINGRQVQQCNPQSTPDYSYGCTSKHIFIVVTTSSVIICRLCMLMLLKASLLSYFFINYLIWCVIDSNNGFRSNNVSLLIRLFVVVFFVITIIYLHHYHDF